MDTWMLLKWIEWMYGDMYGQMLAYWIGCLGYMDGWIKGERKVGWKEEDSGLLTFTRNALRVDFVPKRTLTAISLNKINASPIQTQLRNKLALVCLYKKYIKSLVNLQLQMISYGTFLRSSSATSNLYSSVTIESRLRRLRTV